MALTEAEGGALSVSWQDAASWMHGYDTAPGGGGPHWGVRQLKALAAKVDAIETQLAALAAGVAALAAGAISDEQLVAALREVLRDGVGAGPQG